MKLHALWLHLVLLLLLTTQASAWIGHTETVFTDKQRNRTLPTHIWYPSQEGKSVQFADTAVFEGFWAVDNGAIRNGKFPLYILLHGTMGNWRTLSWLAARLAEGGAIVVAANHPGYTFGNATPATVIRMWDQPKDASFLLDALADTDFGKHIDKDRVYVAGFSLGGYSAMALAGAQLDMRKYPDFCARHNDEACRYFRSTFAGFDATYFKDTAVNLTDKRFAASIAIAPGFVESMTAESLKKIKTPTLVIGAQRDTTLPPQTHFDPRLSDFSGAIQYHEIKEASHFSFMPLCKPRARELLKEDKFICIDGRSKPRRAIHDELYRLITDYTP